MGECVAYLQDAAWHLLQHLTEGHGLDLYIHTRAGRQGGQGMQEADEAYKRSSLKRGEGHVS